MGQAQNLATRRDGPGQPVKILDGIRNSKGQSLFFFWKGHKSAKLKVFLSFLGMCFFPRMSRDRGFCPGIFSPALALGQRDIETRKYLYPWKKGQFLGNPNLLSSFPWLLLLWKNLGNQKGQWCQLVASVSIARSIKGMINQSGARMFVSCCNNAVLTKSANYKNNKHLCTKYKCIQIFQNLYIYFWEYINSEKKRWEKNCTIHHR